ncbi:unnamed protein product [Protopolystoma xenopodis]|uniref:Uncharacterized protein n=1 Tax=Protopolystoma xenopodis TaxID=117903 RepID=A0A3S5CGX8_9PLAT|nr:unnamed protein product [Protopolystoma xenopodis]
MELTAEREISQRQADRREARMIDLTEKISLGEARERDLRDKIKRAERTCSDIEAKRKADGVMWRIRLMELSAQLAESRQRSALIECRYEALIASRRLHTTAVVGTSTDARVDAEAFLTNPFRVKSPSPSSSFPSDIGERADLQKTVGNN